jgi:hypothetical protein
MVTAARLVAQNIQKIVQQTASMETKRKITHVYHFQAVLIVEGI